MVITVTTPFVAIAIVLGLSAQNMAFVVKMREGMGLEPLLGVWSGDTPGLVSLGVGLETLFSRPEVVSVVSPPCSTLVIIKSASIS